MLGEIFNYLFRAIINKSPEFSKIDSINNYAYGLRNKSVTKDVSL